MKGNEGKKLLLTGRKLRKLFLLRSLCAAGAEPPPESQPEGMQGLGEMAQGYSHLSSDPILARKWVYTKAFSLRSPLPPDWESGLTVGSCCENPILKEL